jgi:hypothetical protein
MPREDADLARAAMFETIENQIRDNDPPETRQTLNRLIGEGHSRDEAMKLIACVLANEIFGIMNDQTVYDNARYVSRLQRLPELPWDNEDK